MITSWVECDDIPTFSEARVLKSNIPQPPTSDKDLNITIRDEAATDKDNVTEDNDEEDDDHNMTSVIERNRNEDTSSDNRDEEYGSDSKNDDNDVEEDLNADSVASDVTRNDDNDDTLVLLENTFEPGAHNDTLFKLDDQEFPSKVRADNEELLQIKSRANDEEAKETEAALVILGQGAVNEADGEAVLSQAMKLAEAMGAKLLVLHTAAARVGALDVGAVTDGGLTAALDGAEVIYNLGAAEVEIAAGPMVIYQGSHGDRGAHRADIILPGAAYTEENGLFVNTEGRPQLALRAGFAPGEAKENWAILRALSAELGATLPWDSMAGLRRALVAAHPHLGQVDQVAENDWARVPLRDPAKATFRPAVKDFYLTNPIARASAVMAELSAMAKSRAASPLAAE